MSVFLPTGINALVKTLRIKWSGDQLPAKCVVAFWHSKMIAGWYISRSNAVAMVSPSKDGNYLSSILQKWKYRVVRGSSSKNGTEALHEAIECIVSGETNRIVITPDGPRGPKEVFKRGAIIAAKELDIPLFFLHIKYKDGMKFMKSWDRFELPYPFSLIEVHAQEIDISAFPESKDNQILYLKDLSRTLQQQKR